MSTRQLVELKQLPNGNLEITILYKNDPKQDLKYIDIVDEIEELHRNYATNYVDLIEVLEYWNNNDEYEVLNDFDLSAIGALTSSPVIGYVINRDDNGDLQDVQKTWWYPNYQVLDPVEELLKDGYVIFESGDA